MKDLSEMTVKELQAALAARGGELKILNPDRGDPDFKSASGANNFVGSRYRVTINTLPESAWGIYHYSTFAQLKKCDAFRADWECIADESNIL